MLPRGARMMRTLPSYSSTGLGNGGQRFSLVCHPDRRARGFRPGHESLLTEHRRPTGRVPAGYLAALLAAEPHLIGVKCRPVGVGMTWRRLITAGTMPQWRLRLEEVNREVTQCGGAVPG